MAIDAAAVFTNFSGVFPDVLGVNASGPSATDGTEFVAIMINNYLFGPQQALLDYASLTPDAVTEAAGASQTIEAMQKGFGVGSGKYVWWGLFDDPSVTGDRVILLSKQGVLRSTYTELDNNIYVGDGNNATAPYRYHADDAAGTTRNIAGIYLILPPGKQLYEKQYSEAAGDFAVTGTNWTTTRAVAIPYQTADGAWRLRFNIDGIQATSESTINLTVSGVVFKTGMTQAISGTVADSGILTSERTSSGTGALRLTCTVAQSASVGWRLSGDVELDSEPTWTDGFNYKLGIAY